MPPMNTGYFHSHSNDAGTASTMKRMRSGDTGPNGTKSGVLQKGPPTQANGPERGNTPNSVPSDTNSGNNYGQRMVHVNDPTMVVAPLHGIPAHDPNEGGASGLQKTSQAKGFTTRSSGGRA